MVDSSQYGKSGQKRLNVRKQSKTVIRTLLNQMDITSNFEMFICSVVQNEMKFGAIGPVHIAFDLDDSYQNGKVKIAEATKRWRMIKSCNYRAPSSIKYDRMIENYQSCNENYKELPFFNDTQEWI